MIYLDGKPITPTIFPDGTSQVWKIDKPGSDCASVVFVFESEAEVFHLLQLAMLLNHMGHSAKLHMPFLPYGRQDKPVGNDRTFSLHLFGRLLRMCEFTEVSTIDAHSNLLHYYVKLINLHPQSAIDNAISATGATTICYPDSGAHDRYSDAIQGEPLVLGKVRDQSTGNITGIELVSGEVRPNDSILIVDDICDGGRTFIEACKLIKSIEPTARVHLYVSHGIFSKGLDVLHSAGIEQIFTKDGKVYEPVPAY
jgi:ribose-phosphate pyrophosphokinase